MLFTPLHLGWNSSMAGRRLLSVDFEVFGRVQGVFFRKFTKHRALDLGLVGWVRNTSRRTVTGTMQGPDDKVSQMKRWLQTEGSPHSRIDQCEFKNEKEVSSLTFQSFDIRN